MPSLIWSLTCGCQEKRSPDSGTRARMPDLRTERAPSTELRSAGVTERTSTDLLVIGGTLAGLSLAIQAKEAGLDRVLVIEPGREVAAAEVIGQHALSVEYRADVTALSSAGSPSRASPAKEAGTEQTPRRILIGGERLAVEADLVAVAVRPVRPSRPPGYPIPPSLNDRVHLVPPSLDWWEKDVLVVGVDEEAAELTSWLATQGAGVVLAFGGADLSALSRLGRRQLLRLEAERRATILWNSQPEALEDVAGFPMAYFGDRRTPDLQFDHVVYRQPRPTGETALSPWHLDLSGEAPPRVYLMDPSTYATVVPTGVKAVQPGHAWESIRADHLPWIPAPSTRPRAWRPGDRQQIADLSTASYNATITKFERSHSDLWILRVRPDHGDTHHVAGQYATLGLGYWEPRADGARDPGLEKSWPRLIRRSYSISSPLFDPTGYLFDPSRSAELEFYVVLVPPAADRVPALTPRLALKGPDDRIYLGPKVTGRYTLSGVVDPERRLVFLATGTGEAPHNSMLVELLRKGHRGPIVSVVSVRQWDDLGYLEQHRELEKRFANYRHLPLVTRDPGRPKLYIQDVIRDGKLEETLNAPLDPAFTDVFLCGNPAMIGLPLAAENGTMDFPAVVGVCQLLAERGFSIDRRGTPGNVHYEEYW